MVPGLTQITLKVNSREHTVDVDGDTPLLFVLNDDLGLRGPRFGCGLAQCGACTVMLQGKAVRSCVMPVGAVGAAEVTTLEGLGTAEKLHPIQQAFLEEGAAQCGFCLSGVILTAKAFLDGNPDASDQEIREALGGILCRCFAHVRMLRAIRKYAEGRKHDSIPEWIFKGLWRPGGELPRERTGDVRNPSLAYRSDKGRLLAGNRR
jgi:nicotinate dehydrogenase subunit A